MCSSSEISCYGDVSNLKSLSLLLQMESELERFQKQNMQLELNISELKLRQKALDQELHTERQVKRDTEAMLRRYKTDLHNCVGYIQEPKVLKECVVSLYKKHVQEDIVSHSLLDFKYQ